MYQASEIKNYPPAEERINIFSHVFGLVLSVIATVLLIKKSMPHQDVVQDISVLVFGFSLIILYGVSSIYHSSKEPWRRSRFRVLDHASIYCLIAGTYTPFSLLVLKGDIGWLIFSVAWGMALAGIIVKLFFTGRFQLLSTLMYVFMGWLIVFAIDTLMDNLSKEGLQWLVAGGLSYTFGAILYAIKKIPFNHAIFHIFVLLGSFCHFVSVYNYVLPAV